MTVYWLNNALINKLLYVAAQIHMIIQRNQCSNLCFNEIKAANLTLNLSACQERAKETIWVSSLCIQKVSIYLSNSSLSLCWLSTLFHYNMKKWKMLLVIFLSFTASRYKFPFFDLTKAVENPWTQSNRHNHSYKASFFSSYPLKEGIHPGDNSRLQSAAVEMESHRGAREAMQCFSLPGWL